VKSYRHRAGSIEWYCESRGSGSPVVLIPSGEGDCGSFEKVAELLARDFTVFTFDMPGFSRSSDPDGFDDYSTTQAANEVAELIRAHNFPPATFYGCSSGGQIALCLAADHSELIQNIVVHEVPLSLSPMVSQLTALSDDEVVRRCSETFRNHMNENSEAWDALGEDYHRRLARNYVTWVRRYVGRKNLLRTFTVEELRRRPVTWTIGGLTPAAAFFENVVVAHSAGLQIGLLMCRHFPQVSIPGALAEHIRRAASADPT
jgi:pimeloyl-ACP methyl ester carboxylesterase